MRLYDGIVLYHASFVPVEVIDLQKCSTGKDFGRGFYLTSDYIQAKKFILSSIRKAVNVGDLKESQSFGFVSTFIFHGNPENYHCFDFPDANEAWLRFIAYNRSQKNRNRLRPQLIPGVMDAEIITGKVANDKTNPTITAYLNGLYGALTDDIAIETAIRLLKPNELKDQFCFCTLHSLQSLEFKEVVKEVVKNE